MVEPTIYRAGWVLPVTAAPIPDGAVAVDEAGHISGVGPAGDVRLPGAAVVDLGETALLPGLVNAHAHLELSFLRGMLDDLAFTDWIAALLHAKQAAGLGESDYLAAARWSVVEMLAAGITTVGATEDSTAAMQALLESGQRGVVFRELFGPDPEGHRGSIERFTERVKTMRELETDVVRVGISPHAPFTVSDPLFRAAAELSRELGMPLAVHAAESRAETEFITAGQGVFAERLRARGIPVQRRSRSTIALLDDLGVLEARPLLIHCVQVDEADITKIAERDAPVVHCPIANARLGHGAAPVNALITAGVTVGLGSDSVASNNRVDMLEEARTAQLVHRVCSGESDGLPSGRLLRMVTIDGARALGLDARIGSLETGKDADLCAVSLSTAHARPVHDPLAALFHSVRGTDTVLTVVRGRVLYREGHWLTVDEDAIRVAIDELGARVRAATGESPPRGAAGA